MKNAKWMAVTSLVAVLALCVAASEPQGEVREQREVSRGVSYTHLKRTTSAGEPWSIHILEMSRTERKAELRSVLAEGGTEGEMQRQLPTDMAQRVAASGLNVVAVVNGDYDLAAPYMGVSDGLSVTAGAVATTGKPAWPAMALTSSGEPLIAVPQVEMMLEARGRSWPIAALNKPLGTAWGTGLHLYTREFRATVKSDKAFRAVVIGKLSRPLPLQVNKTVSGTVEEIFEGATQAPIATGKLVLVESLETKEGGTGAALKAGEKVKLRVHVEMNGQKKIGDVVGGFPILVEGGRKHIVGEPTARLAQRNPRTAFCINQQKVIFVVVDGRQPKLSVGMTLDELADLMVELGCTTAMNSDGGGSSVMAVALPAGTLKPGTITDTAAIDRGATKLNVKGTNGVALAIVNSPSDGQERGRGNAWIVIQKK